MNGEADVYLHYDIAHARMTLLMTTDASENMINIPSLVTRLMASRTRKSQRRHWHYSTRQLSRHMELTGSEIKSEQYEPTGQ